MPKCSCSQAFSFVFPSHHRIIPVLIMDPMPSPPMSNPTTPDCIFAHTTHTGTLNKPMATFYPISQPAGSTQRALQGALTNNVVFANEAIVHAIFQPSKVDNKTVADILAMIKDNNCLKAV